MCPVILFTDESVKFREINTANKQQNFDPIVGLQSIQCKKEEIFEWMANFTK